MTIRFWDSKSLISEAIVLRILVMICLELSVSQFSVKRVGKAVSIKFMKMILTTIVTNLGIEPLNSK